MAIKTATIASSLGGQATALGLAQNLMQSSSSVGEARALDRNIQSDLRNERLSRATCDAAYQLAERVFDLVNRIGTFEKSIAADDLTSTDAVAKMVLTTQLETFKGQVEGVREGCLYTLRQVRCRAEKEVKELLPFFEKQVGQYLQTRSQKDLDQARRSSEVVGKMNRAVSDLRDFQTQLASREVEYLEESPAHKRIRALTGLLGDGIYYVGHYESLIQKLDALVAEGADEKTLDCGRSINKERINQTIDRLHEEVGSDQVNYWIWKLSGEKLGENYGVVHRYDDLSILREAILRTTKSLADKIMKKEAQELDQEAVFEKLFEMVGEPPVDNPMEWMKQNACYYTQDLKAAIGEVKFPARQLEVLDDFDRLQFDDDFNPSLLQFDLPPSFGSLSASVVPQKHEYTQIFDELAKLDQKEVSSDLRGRVEEMIDQLSKNGLADTINYEIWRLGGQKPGDNWGVAHRYDDAAVLRQALMIAVRRDVHEQVVVKTFADEEDRNAFYAEIGRMAYAFDFDSVPSDFVAYGKEKIVFHLHQLLLAKKEVQAQLAERRESIAYESKKQLDELLEAAIAKNPAVQSIVDMLDLIDQSTEFFAPTGAVETCKAQIRERVEASSFDSALKNQIFLGIWRANGQPLEDLNYGDKHYLDNLETLSHALFYILLETVLSGEQ